MKSLTLTLTGATVTLAIGLLLLPSAGCQPRHEVGAGAGAGDTASLRGYGTVTAHFGDEAVFSCASPEKALVLYSKLRKDLLESGTTAPVAAGEVWRLANGSHAALGVVGNDVHALSAASAEAVRGRIAALGLGFPVASHPKYLDYYDHNAFRFYTRNQNPGQWEFVRSLGLGGLGYQDPSISRSQAEGVLSFVDSDATVRNAERNDGMLVLGPNVGGGLPFWMLNKDPGKMARMQRSMLYSGWCSSVHSASFENDALWDARTSPIIAMQRLIADRYVRSPSLGGWHLNRGQPVGDMIGILMDGCMWDSSAEGKVAYIDYLKSRYTLAELGRRWHGDERHFAAWSAVDPAEVADLWGGSYEQERALLNGGDWSWRKSSKGESGKPPAADGKWLPVTLPPSHRCTLLDSGSAYYRTVFTLPQPMRAKVAEKLYLKMLIYMYDANQVHVWVNGTYVPSQPVFASAVKQHGVELPPGILSAERENEIIIQTPDGRSDGRLHGPIAISALPPDNYPFRDERLNAQYVDAFSFKTEAHVRRISQMIRYARQSDPDRPMVISAGSWDTHPQLMPLMRQYGVGHQYTACEGFLNAQYYGIASVFDYYFSAEPSGSVLTEAAFDRMLGMGLHGGASTFDMFFSVEEYMALDAKTKALTRRKDLLRLAGKYLVDRPNTAIFWSSVLPSSGGSVWNWNLGRGEMQSAHYGMDYLNEQGFGIGAGSAYAVVIDAGNAVLSDEAVGHLTRYVEDGGTYDILPPTGQHGVLKADALPVQRLSGFRIAGRDVPGGIVFASSPSLFGCWAGRRFAGDGVASDYQNNAVSRHSGLALQPIAPDTEALARWESGGVAIGVRRLGKGRVVTLGTSFWRDGRDINGKWLPSARNEVFEQLLAGLGCRRTADATSERIWVRNAVSKNGLEDWMLAVNIAENEPFAVAADLSFQLGYAPTRIVDRETGAEVAFTVDAGNRVIIPKVPFTKYQTRIFAAARPQPLAECLRTWWGEKTKYWRAAPVESLPLPAPSVPDAIAIDSWRFAPDRDGAITAASRWNGNGFDDRGWRDLASGSWRTLDAACAGYDGVGLYRRGFAIPAGWKGTVTLNFQSPVAHDVAEFFVNGTSVARNDRAQVHPEFRGIESVDISRLLDPSGANTLAVAVKGGKGLAGISESVWIAREQVLAPAIDLQGGWEAVKGDLMTAAPAAIPGRVKARCLRRSFEVPQEWAGRQVYLHLETPAIWCAVVMVNEQMRSFHMENSPFGTRFDLNITDLVKAGGTNRIELWHRHTAPPNWRGVQWGWPTESDLSISAIRVGCVGE